MLLSFRKQFSNTIRSASRMVNDFAKNYEQKTMHYLPAETLPVGLVGFNHFVRYANKQHWITEEKLPDAFHWFIGHSSDFLVSLPLAHSQSS